MFLEKYLDEFYYNEVIDNYKGEYLEILNEEDFIKICNLLKGYGFYYLKDIIVKYLEIFTMEEEEVIQKIEMLKEVLGNDFVNIIGNNMKYLKYIIE